MSRRLLWPIVLTLSGSGVLVGHDLAYRLAGVGGDGLHGYLAHAPQLLAALLLPALLVAVSGGRREPPRPWAFALLGAGAFTAMEQLERLGDGGLPLLSSPVFLIGLALQLPFALAAWLIARTLVALEAPPAPWAGDAIPPRVPAPASVRQSDPGLGARAREAARPARSPPALAGEPPRLRPDASRGDPMHPKFRRFALVLATVGLVVSLFVALRPDDADEEAGSTTTAAATQTATTEATVEPIPTTTTTTTADATTTEPPPATTTAPAEPAFDTVRVTVTGGRSQGGVQRATIEQGRDVVLVVRADVSDRIHVHGYDLTAAVAPGSPARIRFTADVPGRFEVELEDRGIHIADLQVRP